MKRYLWTAVAVLFVNASASENPFALKENLLKIDNDQEMLLSELGKIAEARAEAEEEEEKVAPVVEVVEAEEVNEVDPEEGPVKMEDSEEQFKLANSIDELVGDDDKDEGTELAASQEGLEDNTQKEEPVSTAIVDEARKRAMADSAQEAKKAFEAALKIAQEKEAQEKADYEKAEQAQAQKEADEKAKLAEDARETEKREVAAYEKQRAEKLAKQAEADAKKKAEEKPEQVAEIDVEAEKKAAKETADTGYKDAVKEMGGSEKIVTSKPTVEKTEMAEEKSVEKVAVADGDIDVEAEKAAAKETADSAYLEAIREMDQED